MEDLYGRKKAYVNTGLIALNVLYFLFLEATGSSEIHHSWWRTAPCMRRW